MKNDFKPGDVVIITSSYPSLSGNSTWYNVGDVVILQEQLIETMSNYWLTSKHPNTHRGVFNYYFRKLTKLDKALS